jgi:cold shock CspA family protein
MKYQGKISSWNEERGFGFIKWNGADDKLFVHISAFTERRRKPAEGDIVTYEVGKDANGRSQALNVVFVIPARRNISVRSVNTFSFGRFVPIALIVLLGIVGYFKFAPQEFIKPTELGSVTQGVSQSRSTQTNSTGAIASIPEHGSNESDAAISSAFANHQSSVQVSGQGIVAKLLPDDNTGSQHQRFILRLASGQTLLVAHNIDIAQRISSIREGDSVEFYGQYEWNEKGGVVHWTHHDPSGSHVDGWLQYQGQRYQ